MEEFMEEKSRKERFLGFHSDALKSPTHCYLPVKTLCFAEECREVILAPNHSHSKVDSLLSTFYLILRRLKCLIDSLCFYRSEAAKRQFVVGEETVDLCLDFVRISLVIPVKIGISTMGAFCIAIRIVSILPRSRIFAAT